MKTNNKPNLTPVTLSELVNSERIIYLNDYDDKDKQYKRNLSRNGRNITFYVDSKTSLAIPLRMKLYSNKEPVLIPNQPVGALKYEQKGEWWSVPKIYATGVVELPFGLFYNRRRFPEEKKTYFPRSESGWKTDGQGKLLEARVEFKINEGIISKSISIIQYQL